MIAARSPIVVLAIRVATPLAAVVGVYLLFAGHNQPGGGFAAGLVFGAIAALRTVAGLPTIAAPDTLLALGIVVIAVVALAPLTWGDPLLDQQVISAELPVLGKVKTGSALPFDVGVSLVVVALVVAVLQGLGADELGRRPRPTGGEA